MGEKFKLNMATINPCVKNMEYAVRGKVPQEAAKIEQEIQLGSNKYPFKSVVHCNIGDSHAMGQKPLTFVRQLLAACTDPELRKQEGLYPADVVERENLIVRHCGGRSIGSYSSSCGISIIREHVADSITERDGFKCSHESIFLLNGASEGIKTMLFVIMGHLPGRKTGIMIPFPRYPLYSATIAQFDAEMVTYTLKENNNWALDMDDIKMQLYSARERCDPRVLVIINPGNPTGIIMIYSYSGTSNKGYSNEEPIIISL